MVFFFPFGGADDSEIHILYTSLLGVVCVYSGHTEAGTSGSQPPLVLPRTDGGMLVVSGPLSSIQCWHVLTLPAQPPLSDLSTRLPLCTGASIPRPDLHRHHLAPSLPGLGVAQAVGCSL